MGALRDVGAGGDVIVHRVWSVVQGLTLAVDAKPRPRRTPGHDCRARRMLLPAQAASSVASAAASSR